MTIKYLAIDPGKTTGWAGADDDGELVELGQVTDKEFHDWILTAVHPGLRAVICEDYVIMGHKAKSHSWKRADTSEKIGAIELVCRRDGVKLVKQRNTVKNTGYQWAGLTPPSNHSISHQFDAWAHFVYWAQSNGIRNPGQDLNLKKA